MLFWSAAGQKRRGFIARPCWGGKMARCLYGCEAVLTGAARRGRVLRHRINGLEQLEETHTRGLNKPRVFVNARARFRARALSV